MNKEDIRHEPERQRFVVETGGEQAVLDYNLQNSAGAEPAAINFTHTFVPPAFRGTGVAEALVRHGLAWARQQDYRISASCWYVARFLR